MDVKFVSDTKIADSEREFKMNQAAYQKEVNTAVSFLRSISQIVTNNKIVILLFNILINVFEGIVATLKCFIWGRKVK